MKPCDKTEAKHPACKTPLKKTTKTKQNNNNKKQKKNKKKTNKIVENDDDYIDSIIFLYINIINSTISVKVTAKICFLSILIHF